MLVLNILLGWLEAFKCLIQSHCTDTYGHSLL